MNRKTLVKGIEKHLFNYQQYKVAIGNLQRQLDYILPNITANYEIMEGTTGTFSLKSSTENTAIDRIESRRALNIHEQMKRLDIIIFCIDESVHHLQEQERHFVELRYFKNLKMEEVAEMLGYSPQHTYRLRDQVLDKLLISLASIQELKE